MELTNLLLSLPGSFVSGCKCSVVLVNRLQSVKRSSNAAAANLAFCFKSTFKATPPFTLMTLFSPLLLFCFNSSSHGFCEVQSLRSLLSRAQNGHWPHGTDKAHTHKWEIMTKCLCECPFSNWFFCSFIFLVSAFFGRISLSSFQFIGFSNSDLNLSNRCSVYLLAVVSSDVSALIRSTFMQMSDFNSQKLC